MDENKGKSLSALYERQEAQLHRPAPRANVMRLAAWLQRIAAVIGPLSLGSQPALFFFAFVSPELVITYDIPLASLSVVILILAGYAWSNRRLGLLYIGGVLGLFMFRFFFVGTFLSIASLVLLVFARETRT